MNTVPFIKFALFQVRRKSVLKLRLARYPIPPLYIVIDYDEIKDMANEAIDTAYLTRGVKLIAVGRLVEIKGFERLLRVVSELKASYDFELWILGQGPLYDQLNGYIRQNALHNVRLLGYQENPYPYMQCADCLVCSSFSEGYSTVVLEALALGVPVLTTDCPGMDELVKPGNRGYIVENSETGLKKGLEYILKEKKALAEIRNNAQNYCSQEERATERYIALFES